jgi:hypothetical protein
MSKYKNVTVGRKAVVISALACASLFVLAACSTAPTGDVVQKPIDPAPIAACCSATGHNPDNVPFILGGNCFCTPDNRIVEAMHAAGKHTEVDYKKLVQLYSGAGIATDFDHKGCNNLCELGPHVAFGGKCMVTPMPGTKNFERVMAVTAEQVTANASNQ